MKSFTRHAFSSASCPVVARPAGRRLGLRQVRQGRGRLPPRRGPGGRHHPRLRGRLSQDDRRRQTTTSPRTWPPPSSAASTRPTCTTSPSGRSRRAAARRDHPADRRPAAGTRRAGGAGTSCSADVAAEGRLRPDRGDAYNGRAARPEERARSTPVIKVKPENGPAQAIESGDHRQAPSTSLGPGKDSERQHAHAARKSRTSRT